jgi:hypothetical protein
MAIPDSSLIHRLAVVSAIVGLATAPAARAANPDRAQPRGQTTPSVTIVEPGSFDWGDAGVGAAGAFGLVLLAGGAAIVLWPDRVHAMRTWSRRSRGNEGPIGGRRG